MSVPSTTGRGGPDSTLQDRSSPCDSVPPTLSLFSDAFPGGEGTGGEGAGVAWSTAFMTANTILQRNKLMNETQRSDGVP